jgi:hypothetical protein
MLKVQTEKPRGISKIWLTNDVSATLIIPVEVAKKHGLTKGNHVLVEDTDHGILIRKLNLEAE